MKNCPHCGNTFSDELNYCFDDGTVLIYETDADKTIPFKYPSTDENLTASSSEKTIPFNYASKEIPASLPITNSETANVSSKWHFLIIGILATILAGAVVVYFFLPSENAVVSLPYNEKLTPNGDWSGDWNTENSYFTATANFVENNGDITGRIIWTLKRTTKPEKIEKIGTSAVKYVEGKFDAETKLLNLRGVRKEDPNNLVILDKYTLSLAEDNKSLLGKSINGSFFLKK